MSEITSFNWQKSSGLCKICGQNSSGNHFGIESCRACAAFFRRAAMSKWAHLPCKTKNCDKKILLCKSCRLRRCMEAGMSTSNFQFNRDILKRVFPRTVENFVGRPSLVIFCESPESPKSKRNYIDVQSIVEKVSKTLRNGPEGPIFGKSQLLKLANGFQLMNNRISIKMVKVVSKQETADCWEYFIGNTAKWLTCFDEFRKLPDQLQLKLTLAIWHTWGRLEKHAITAVLRKQQLFSDKHFIVVGRDALINLTDFDYDHTWLTDYPQEQVEYFTGLKYLEMYEVVDYLMDLEPTHVELTFMIAQLSFQYAGSRFRTEDPEILEATEKFQDILSNDLHEYYVNERNMPRYSDRLARMLKINNMIQKYIRDLRPRAELARTFNIFKVEFSHPDIFIDTGF